MNDSQVLQRSQESVLATNKLITNTYTLLSMTMIFSAVMAGVSMAINTPPLHWAITLVGMFGLLFLTHLLRNSIWGLAAVFAFTGFMGFTLGPMLNMVMTLSNGGQIIMTALGGTGVIFLGLSGYALTTKKDFNFMGGFLFVGLLLVVVAGIANIFLHIPALSLAISSVVVLIMAGLILYDTSRMIHDDGTGNYITMTVSLYLSIYNLFISLIHLLTAFMGDD